MPISARSSLSGSYSCGTNSGSITLAMNSTVISGTPRTNSMKTVDTSRTVGIGERRPSASTMPSGSEQHDADRGHHDGDQHAAPQHGVDHRQAEQRNRAAG